MKNSLLPNAVPSIFKDVPDHSSKRSAASRRSPSKRLKRVPKLHKAEQDDQIDSDLIGTYDHMVSSLAEYLQGTYPSITYKKCGDHVVLYKVDLVEDKDQSPWVALTVRIFMDFSIRVFIGSERIPDSGLQWALSHTKGKLKHWRQLNDVIDKYSIAVVVPI